MHNDSYVGRQPAWQRLGKVTGQFMTWTDILQAGGLAYDVFKDQLQYAGQPIDAYGTFRLNGDETDRSKATFLGTVGKDYEVIQHARGFELIDRLMGKVEGAHYETAGSLGDGQIVWGLADLKRSIWIGDDETKSYLLFVTAHDGSVKHQYRLCNTRMISLSTLNISLREKTASVFGVKHTVNAEARLEDAEAALESIDADIRSVGDRLQFLASRKMTTRAIEIVLDEVLPKNSAKAKTEDGEDSTRRSNILMQIMMNYASNDDNKFPEQRGTAYNLLNAITNYADHSRVVKGEKENSNARPESALFGLGDKIKTRALEVITRVAADGKLTSVAQVFAPALAHEDSPEINEILAEEIGLLDNVAEHTEASGVRPLDHVTHPARAAVRKQRGRPSSKALSVA